MKHIYKITLATGLYFITATLPIAIGLVDLSPEYTEMRLWFDSMVALTFVAALAQICAAHSSDR